VPPRLCHPRAITCPRCGSVQYRMSVGLGSHVFRICDGKPNGVRCNWWLFILRAGPFVTVSAVTGDERDALERVLETGVPEPASGRKEVIDV
jgi:hypothetical protein